MKQPENIERSGVIEDLMNMVARVEKKPTPTTQPEEKQPEGDDPCQS